MTRSSFLRSCSALLTDRRGNFGLTAAILLPVLLATGGVAVDYTNMVMARKHLQDATDAAALAASSALVNDGVTVDEAKFHAMQFLKVEMQNWATSSAQDELAADDAFSKGTEIEIAEEKAALGNAKRYVVTVASQFELGLNPMTRLLGKEKAGVNARSVSESSADARNALSMFLVLDRSGSMGEVTKTVDAANPTRSYTCGKKLCTATNYVTKIAALKLATADLLTTLKTADIDASLVRTGAVSYNSAMQSPTKLDWGTANVLTYVNALVANGGTDSGDAFKTAYQKLTATTPKSEADHHQARNGQQPKKYIVFMTDGDNNYTSADTTTKKWCDKARTDEIEVYSVAFMAPDRGQALLNYCATSQAHYFVAENGAELTAVFKHIGEKASEMTVRLTQ